MLAQHDAVAAGLTVRDKPSLPPIQDNDSAKQEKFNRLDSRSKAYEKTTLGLYNCVKMIFDMDKVSTQSNYLIIWKTFVCAPREVLSIIFPF